jgi:nitroimidazol reductase NimA-like FMN-containing flavoprotein (pyridoxamine 5'-phosphate oxidase superfamily)
MNYTNANIRRQDRLLDEQSALELLKKGEYGVLAMLNESIVLECKAFRNLPDDEKMKAFGLILDKYSPDEKIKGMQYAKDAFNKTEIVRLDIENWSGKSKVFSKS